MERSRPSCDSDGCLGHSMHFCSFLVISIQFRNPEIQHTIPLLTHHRPLQEQLSAMKEMGEEMHRQTRCFDPTMHRLKHILNEALALSDLTWFDHIDMVLSCFLRDVMIASKCKG